MTDLKKLDSILEDVRAEVIRASDKNPPMNSPHEGWAVLREEVDELWDEVKASRGGSPQAQQEAVQVAAMGVRYIMDLTYDELEDPIPPDVIRH